MRGTVLDAVFRRANQVDGGATVSAGGDGMWWFGSGLRAGTGHFDDSLSVGTNLVHDIGLLNDAGDVYAHMEAEDNPHNVTIAQLDENEAVAEHLGETYGLHMSEADGVGPIEGFGHYISPEEHLWQWNTGEDLVFASPGGTVDFQTEGVPTYHGTNLATMTDLSVSVAELASYAWVRSQIASATAGSYASLPAFNSHTNDANAHGLGALRATVDALPTEARVLTLIDDAIGDLGDVATQGDLANYVPGPVYTAATNDLWGAFAGMATDSDIAAATNGLANASDVSALDGRVTVLESTAFGPDGTDVSTLVSGLVAVSGRVDTAESDIAALQEVAGAAWPTNPAADERVVFPKMSYYQNENDRPVIDPGFYDQGIAPHRSGAISNLALLAASRVEAGKMLLHGDPVLAGTHFSSNYIAGGSVIPMPHTFAAEDEPLWCHYNYPDYIAKLHFVWSNATYTEERTIYDEDTDTETTETVTNHCQPSVSLRITATNMANEEVEFTLVPRLDGTDQVLYIDRVPLYLVNGFTVETSGYPVPTTTADPVLVGFWYEKSQEYGEEYDLYGKVLMVDEPAEARGVANKGYVDDLVGGVDLSAIYNRDKTTKLNGHDLVLNPRYTVTWSNNDMTIGYGGFPVMTFKGGMRVEPCMTALTPRGTTIYAYCSGMAASEIRLEWCTNTLASAGMPFEEVPAERIIAQYMSDEYTWCTEIDGTGISACWMRAWLTSLTQALTDVELVTEEGPQSMAELFAKVAELHAATNLYATVTDLTAHTARQDNPHHVTAAQIGALTAESDTAALAALAAASNHFEAAIADIGDNLPGLADFAARLAALEAWKNGSHSGGIVTNKVFEGVGLTALTNLGETVWTDVAIASETMSGVLVGEESFIWEERIRNNTSTFTNLAPKRTLNGVAVGDDEKLAIAIPGFGRPYIRSVKNGPYSMDVSGGPVAYWDKVAIADGGTYGALSGHKGIWTVTSDKAWLSFTNSAGAEYTDATATYSGEILFSGDTGGRHLFSLVTNRQGVCDGQIQLPAGVSTNAKVLTRMPKDAAPVTVSKVGTASWPTATNSTNTYTEKVTGGPWLDVMVDGTTPHPLYVRDVAKWDETRYVRLDSGTTRTVTNWTTVNQLLYFTNTYQFYGTGNVLDTGQTSYHMFRLYGVFAGPRPPDGWSRDNGDRLRVDKIELGEPSAVPNWPTVVADSRWWNDQGAHNYEIRYSGEGVTEEPEQSFPYKPKTYYWRNYLYDFYEGTSTVAIVTNCPAAKYNRFADAYEPIQAAGSRCWVDAAVSMDSEMRRIWAVEANGHVWRMTGSDWWSGIWTSQNAPGTNMWTQVVCSDDGERAIAIGDCMIPTGATYGEGTNAVPLEANAWYFDSREWHPLAQPVRNLDGTVGCVKWKKAYISETGYTAYLLPDGAGYAYKMAYY